MHRIGSRVPVPLALLVGATLLAGCASSAGTASRTDLASERSWQASEAESRLRTAATRWDGTPHQLGGTSPSGVDCSGLVQSVFASEFRVQLPRTTEQQARVGRPVSRSRLRPGDLLFFRPGWKKRHVGIYLSDGEFLHASESEGVTVSSLQRSYWQEHWWKARRLLAVSADSSRPPAKPSSPSSTVGW